MDIVQESIRRVLSGSRPWPKSEPFMNFMAGVIKSVADYENRRGSSDGRLIVSSETDIHKKDASDNLIENHPSFDDSVIERELMAAEELKNIESIFEDDEKALAIVMGREEGFTGSEIQEMFGMSKTAYESAAKKVNRRMTKFNNEQ